MTALSLRYARTSGGVRVILEIHARDREVARVLFVLDACDRKIIAWLSVANAGISGEIVRDLRVAVVERRFGTTKTKSADG